MLSTCLLNFCEEYIMRNAGLDDSQAGIKIAGRSINNLRYADDNMLMANRWGKVETVTDFIFLGSKITMDVTATMKLKDTCFFEGKQ